MEAYVGEVMSTRRMPAVALLEELFVKDRTGGLFKTPHFELWLEELVTK